MRELLKHTYIVTVKPKTQSTVQTCTTFFPLFFFFFTLFKQLQFVTIKLQLQFVTVKTNYLNFNKGEKKEKKRKKNVHGGYIYAGWETFLARFPVSVKLFGSVPEISVFPTEISVSGLEILPYEHFIPVTEMNSGSPDGIVSHCLLYFPHHKRPIYLQWYSFKSYRC